MSSDGMSGGNTVDQQTAAGLGAGEGGDGTAQLTSADQVRLACASWHARAASFVHASACRTCARTACTRAQHAHTHTCPARGLHTPLPLSQIMYFGEAQLADVFFVLYKLPDGSLTRMDMSMSRDTLGYVLKEKLDYTDKDPEGGWTLRDGPYGWTLFKSADWGLPIHVLLAGGRFEAAYFHPWNAAKLLGVEKFNELHQRALP